VGERKARAAGRREVFDRGDDPHRQQLSLVGHPGRDTEKTGPAVTKTEEAARYRVNALGFAASALLPGRKVSVGAKYFKEFSNRSTFQGYSIQISAAISL
jgi:hypothetical protein